MFGLFDLLALVDPLVEHAEFVTDAVAVAGIAVGRQRIEEAGGQPAETPVAERGVHLAFDHLGGVDAEALQRLVDHPVDAEVEQALFQTAADQVLHRQVIDAPGIGAVLGLRRGHQALAQHAAQQEGQGVVPVAFGGELGSLPTTWTM